MGQERQRQLPRSHDLSLCLTLSNRTNARKPYFGDLTPDSRCPTAMLRALIVGSSSPSSLTSIIVGIRHDGYYDEKYFTLRHHQVRGNLRIKTTKSRREYSLRVINFHLLRVFNQLSQRTLTAPPPPAPSIPERRPCPPNHPPNLHQNLAPTLPPKPNCMVALFSLVPSISPLARLTPFSSEPIPTPPNPRWNTNPPPTIAASPALCKLKTRVSSKSKTMLSNNNWSPSASSKAHSPMSQVDALRR